MAASPAEPAIARVFGGQVIAGSPAPGPASHDRFGLRHVFTGGEPGWQYALDVERHDTALDPALETVLAGIADAPPLRTWTLIEALAKLHDRPAHLMLRAARAGLGPLLAGIETAHPTHPTHVMTLARRRLSR